MAKKKGKGKKGRRAVITRKLDKLRQYRDEKQDFSTQKWSDLLRKAGLEDQDGTLKTRALQMGVIEKESNGFVFLKRKKPLVVREEVVNVPDPAVEVEAKQVEELWTRIFGMAVLLYYIIGKPEQFARREAVSAQNSKKMGYTDFRNFSRVLGQMMRYGHVMENEDGTFSFSEAVKAAVEGLSEEDIRARIPAAKQKVKKTRPKDTKPMGSPAPSVEPKSDESIPSQVTALVKRIRDGEPLDSFGQELEELLEVAGYRQLQQIHTALAYRRSVWDAPVAIARARMEELQKEAEKEVQILEALRVIRDKFPELYEQLIKNVGLSEIERVIIEGC